MARYIPYYDRSSLVRLSLVAAMLRDSGQNTCAEAVESGVSILSLLVSERERYEAEQKAEATT